MTFQPPPPPPQGPPPSQWPPPPGQPGRPGGSFDPKSVNPLDWAILGTGALAFIFSFVSYYTVSYSAGFGSASGSENAWNGFFGWFAMLLALIGSGVIALELFMPHVKLPFPNRLVCLGAYALATISVLLALVVFPEDVPSISGVDTGRGFGYWVSLIVIIAGLVLSFMRAQQTGTRLPGPLAGLPPIGGRRLGAGTGSQPGMSAHGPTPQGPPPGYGPPPQGPPSGYGPPPQGPPPGYGPPPQGPPPGYGQQPPPAYPPPPPPQ